MGLILKYAPLVASAYLIFVATFMDTDNSLSAFCFKFAPALLGLLLLLPFAVEALK